MARRGKTKLKSGPDQAPMQRALEQGEAAVHRSSEAVRQQTNINQDANLRVWQEAGKQIGKAQDYKEGMERRDVLDKRYEEEQKFRKDKATSDAALAQQRIDLAAREAGRDVSRDPTTQSPFLTEREKALQQEMDGEAQFKESDTGQQAPGTGIKSGGMGQFGADEQGESTAWADELDVPVTDADRRRMAQQQKNLDQPTKAQPFGLSEEGKQDRAFKQSQENQKRDVERMNSMSRLRNAQAAHRRARFAKDTQTQKDAREILQGPIRQSVGCLDATMNNKPIKAQDYKWLMENTVGHPINEVAKKAKNGTAALLPEEKTQLIEHLKNQVDLNSIDFMEKTGEVPDSKYVDWASPTMQRLAQNISYINTIVKSMGLGNYLGVDSRESKSALINQVAAALTKRTLSAPPAGGQVPGAIGPEPQQQPGQPQIPSQNVPNPQTGADMKVRGLTPDEQRNAASISTGPGPSPGAQERAKQRRVGRAKQDLSEQVRRRLAKRGIDPDAQ